MEIFKTIKTSYQILKKEKEICCENIEDKLKQFEVSLEKRALENKLEIVEKYKKMYVDFKNDFKVNKDNCVEKKALNDYFPDKKISQAEFKKRNLSYQQLIEESIKSVEEDKITHKEFFNIIYN